MAGALDMAIAHDNEVDLHRRRISIRRGATGRTIAVATLGYVEGSVSIGGTAPQPRNIGGGPG